MVLIIRKKILRFSKKTNKKSIERGIVDISYADVSSFPFRENMFDLITAVETH